MTFEELEQVVLEATGKLAALDEVVKSQKFGAPKTAAFMCGESGLYYPADYIKLWGIKYGIGLGPQPVSESLQSQYDIPPAPITGETRSVTDIMHPLKSSKAQMDFVVIHDQEVAGRAAVLAIDDPRMSQRAAIVYEKQLVNPRSRIPALRAAWMQKGR